MRVKSVCGCLVTMVDHFNPPDHVRGMKVLDKEAFKQTVTVPALKLRPQQCSKCTKMFKSFLLKQYNVKRFIDVTEHSTPYKLLLLKPIKCGSSETAEKDFTDEQNAWLKKENIDRLEHSLLLSLENWTMAAILKAVLPLDTKEIPSSYESVGHIAHLNLREDVMEYKHLIGEVLLAKNPAISTVVNKTDTIDSTYRFFSMECLAGLDTMVTTVKENGCLFTFDFSKVYWNSRLQSEHTRVINLLKPQQLVVDMFAGVGPFAVPAAKKGCLVYANDLNPTAYECLMENAKKNRVERNLEIFNKDGHQFVREAFLREIREKGDGHLVKGSHIIMNLPATAMEFLGSLKGVLEPLPLSQREDTPLPMIHCYAFSKSEDPKTDVLKQAQCHLGTRLLLDTCHVTHVRDVSPNKNMMRISFQLPYEVAYGNGNHLELVQPKFKDCLMSKDSDGESSEVPRAKRTKTIDK